LSERIARIEGRLQELANRSEEGSSSSANLKSSINALKMHVKQLGDSTTLACRHLTTGLSEVQEATVNIFDWSAQLQHQLELFAEAVDDRDRGNGSGFRVADANMRNESITGGDAEIGSNIRFKKIPKSFPKIKFTKFGGSDEEMRL
jgi:hypothetical protein